MWKEMGWKAKNRQAPKNFVHFFNALLRSLTLWIWGAVEF